MSKWTPGPWEIHKCKCGDPVCNQWVINHSGSEGMFEESDARLIAAAPELVAVLQKYLESAANPHKVDIAAVDAEARALLARIKGES